jgi:hypothetical protein
LLAVSQCQADLKAPFNRCRKMTNRPPESPSKPSRTEEARRIIEEYADDLRKILKKLRKLFN